MKFNKKLLIERSKLSLSHNKNLESLTMFYNPIYKLSPTILFRTKSWILKYNLKKFKYSSTSKPLTNLNCNPVNFDHKPSQNNLKTIKNDRYAINKYKTILRSISKSSQINNLFIQLFEPISQH